MGTGDGRYVLRAAAEHPATLVIGLDANAGAMVKASRHAARRDALPNALFAAAAAEHPPQALAGMAESLTVHFPWGSLLRGVLCHDDAVLAGVAQLLAPAGEAVMLVSVLPKDDAPAVPSFDALSAVYERHGLSLGEAREATAAEVAAAHSSWAKRLHAGAARPVMLLRARALETRPSARDAARVSSIRPRRSATTSSDISPGHPG